MTTPIEYLVSLTSPTQAPGDNTTKIATTAFATTAADAIKDVPSNPQSASYTLALTDRGHSIDTTAEVIVPLNSVVPFSIGTTITITNLGSTSLTITQTVGVTLRQAGTTNTGNRTLSGYGMATIRKVATDTWFIAGSGLL